MEQSRHCLFVESSVIALELWCCDHQRSHKSFPFFQFVSIEAFNKMFFLYVSPSTHAKMPSRDHARIGVQRLVRLVRHTNRTGGTGGTWWTKLSA